MTGRSVLFAASRFVTGRDRSSVVRKYVRGAIAGVAISLVPLILVIDVADGMISGITSRYIELETAHIRANAPDPESARGAAGELRALPAVASAIPEIRSVGVAFANGSQSGAVLRGMEDDFLERDAGFARYLAIEGGKAEFAKSNDAFVSSGIAGKLGLSPGDVFSCVTVLRNGSNGSYLPRINVLRVAAVVSSGYHELDSLWIFLPYDTIRRISDSAGLSCFLDIKLRDRDDTTAATYGAIADSLGPSYTMATWQDLERNLFKSLNTTRLVLLLIMALIVAVASVNVSSAVLMIVLEKRPEIAIMRSMGASPAGIASIFVVAGSTVGAIGAIIGIAVGAALSLFINEIIAGLELATNAVARLLSGGNAEAVRFLNPEFYLDRVPISIDPASLAVVFVLALLLSALASFLPARKASSLPPNEVMRRH